MGKKRAVRKPSPVKQSLVEQLGDSVAQMLFEMGDGNGQANRLELRTAAGRPMGGWSERAAAKAIADKIASQLEPALKQLQQELSLVRTQARKDNARAEDADQYEQWLLEIGKVVGCSHLDEQLPNCIIKALHGR